MKHCSKLLIILSIWIFSHLLCSSLWAEELRSLQPEIKQMLAMTDFAQAKTGKNNEFFLRGIIQSFKYKNPQQLEISLLPIEVLKNPQHYVGLDKFKQGVTLKLNPKRVSGRTHLKVGHILEINQYYLVHNQGSQSSSNAQLVQLEFRQDVQIYGAGAEAYLIKSKLMQPQLVNTLKGLTLYQGKFRNQSQIKTRLQQLGQDKNPDVRRLASQLISNVK